MKRETPINICFVTDENYAPYVGVAILSILKNARKNDFFGEA